METLVFDESQITSADNGNNPEWNDSCHTLHGNADRSVVICFSGKDRGSVPQGGDAWSWSAEQETTQTQNQRLISQQRLPRMMRGGGNGK